MQILLADDHPLVRDGVKHVLQNMSDDHVIWEASSYEGVLASIDQHSYLDLLLLDLVMPGMDGLKAISHIRDILPDTPIVILSFKEEYRIVREAFERGAKGFIPKSTSSDMLSRALELVVAGGIYVPDVLFHDITNISVIDDNNAQNLLSRLTQRQIDVLKLLAYGNTNKNIGRNLELAEATVRTHLTAIFKILGVTNRTQAAQLAVKLGLIPE